MQKLAIIGIYYGQFPEYIELWEKSCSYNENIDFLVFTDIDRKSSIKNIKYINISLEELSRLISNKIMMNIEIKRPYKLCDFRPVYGVIFEDYIKEYEFWGHCDFDIIFGDIKKFITNDITKQYDKILPFGHLSIYRNTKENNNRYKQNGSKVGSYREVFSNADMSYAFDETYGINSIFNKNKYQLYDNRIFADISTRYKRFKLGLKDRNYKKQIFYWENGKIYRAYQENNKMINDEYIYIHFQKRKNMKINIEDKLDNIDSFYITNTGFYKKNTGLPTIEDINKYNRYNGKFYELIELIMFNIKANYKKIRTKLGDK